MIAIYAYAVKNGEEADKTVMGAAARIVRNTMMLYCRQLLIMLVSLYTVRKVLAALGTEDYGIYSAAAGVVTMFGFLSGAMASASQRYFSFDLGRGDTAELKKTFSVMMCIYLLLALAVIALAETAGLWFVLHKLVIPAERRYAAVWVYQFAVLTFAAALMSAPYMAAIIAHEHMHVYAYVSVAEAALKLCIAFALQTVRADTLVVYGMLLFGAGCVTAALYRGYCRKRYEECRFALCFDARRFKEIISFIGWNFFGSFASVMKNQGNVVLLNIFVGPAANASQAVAGQIRNAVSVFSQNFSVAVRPQITKSYAAGMYEHMFALLHTGCKLTFFLMLVITVPLYFNADEILGLWLVDVPELTAVFTRLILLESLVESVSLLMASVNQAVGKISLYQCCVGAAVFLNVPASFFLLSSGFQPESIYAAGIACMVLLCAVRCAFLTQAPQCSLKKLIFGVFAPVCITALCSFWGAAQFSVCDGSLLRCLCDIGLKALLTCACISIFGVSADEKRFLFNLIRRTVS